MKSLDPATLAALDAGHFAVRTLLMFDLPSGRWGVFDDAYDLVWNGDTYVGAAGRVTVQFPPGAADLSVRGLTATFSALDSSAMTWLQNQEYHQRPMFAAMAIIATDTPQIVAVKKWFSGFIDQAPWQENINGEGRIVVRCETASRELERSGARLRTDADQRARDPSDGFFKMTVSAIATDVAWGANVEEPAGKKRKWWQIF